MGLQVGNRLRALNSSCEVIVVKGSDSDAALLCAGVEMLASPPGAGGAQVSDGPKIELGKRYTDDDGTIEVLCTKPGPGPLSFADHVLSIKAAKSLPASD